MMCNKKNRLVFLQFACYAFISVSNAANISNNNDPFIQRWDYFDGLKTYALNITKSNAPGQDYHIDYTFSAGRAATDMCTSISNTSFSCTTGETVTRNDQSHSVKINSVSGSYTFFDPNYMPPKSSILGNWIMNYQGYNYKATFKITIMSGSKDNDFNILSSFSTDNGAHCSYSVPDVYHATDNPDGTKIFFAVNDSQKRFKYDPQMNQITNPEPNKKFVVGDCVRILEDWGPVLFTKQ